MKKHKRPPRLGEAGRGSLKKGGRSLLLFGRFFGGLVERLGVVGAADKAAGHAHLGIAKIYKENIAFNVHNAAKQPAGSNNIGTLAQRGEHGLVFLVALLLRADKQKIEYCEHEDKRDEGSESSHGTFCGGRARGAGGVGEGCKHTFSSIEFCGTKTRGVRTFSFLSCCAFLRNGSKALVWAIA